MTFIVDSQNDSHDGVKDCHNEYQTEDDGCSVTQVCNNLPINGPNLVPFACAVIIEQDEVTSPSNVEHIPASTPTPPLVQQGF